MSMITPELCSTNFKLASQLGAGYVVNYQLLNEAELLRRVMIIITLLDLHNSSDDMKAEIDGYFIIHSI